MKKKRRLIFITVAILITSAFLILFYSVLFLEPSIPQKLGIDFKRDSLNGFPFAILFEKFGSVFASDGANKYKYILYADMDENEYFSQGDIIIEEIELERGVFIKELKSANDSVISGSVNFKPPSPTVNIVKITPDTAFSKESLEIVLSLENDQSKERIISVENSGLVDLK